MPTAALRQDSLVLYKKKAARVRQISDKKLAIETSDGSRLSVRPKDVLLLHPGPLRNLAQLTALNGDVETAWELLAGETTNLEELAELAYDEYSVASAWAAWQLVADGLYFGGTPDAIVTRSEAEVTAERTSRAAKAAEQEAWSSFLLRADQGVTAPEDDQFVQDVVALALGQRKKSRVLNALGQAETRENAHALLLKLGVWDATFDPYPLRAGLTTTSANTPLPPLAEEARRDLTHLPALAIDDEGSLDPDDALSWEDGRLWVHIADAAALITPDSAADQEARSRGANLYLATGTVTMLPAKATQILALGLSEISPALSFGLDLNEVGEITDCEIVPSWVRVTRLSYREAETRLQEAPLRELHEASQRYQARRHANGSISIDLPEVKVRVVDGKVELRPLARLRSRNLVREAMLMTGEAVARFALGNGIPIPFTTQSAPAGEVPTAKTPSAMFALRRMLKPGQKSTAPGAHAGLGMDLYAQATSPLRRYLDLVVHQQLRAFLQGGTPLDSQQILALIGEADEVSRDVRRVERLSNRHWSSVYLLQHPAWQGKGIVVELHGRRHVVLLPQLGLETSLYLRQELPLDSKVELKLREVDLVNLEPSFSLA